MRIVGLSAFYHDAACCLLVDGELVAAASEERFTRVKYDPRLPVEAFSYCLGEGGLDVSDLDAIACHELPIEKLARQLMARSPGAEAPTLAEAVSGALAGGDDLAWLDPGRPERAIREHLGWDGPVLSFPHHLSHAASAFDFSGYPDAAVFTVDGVGEWATTTYGRASGGGIELFEEVSFPHSLGLLYSTVTSYLGFAVNDGEYKVMGLAPYGEPRFLDAFGEILRDGPGGQYRLNPRFFDFLSGPRMYSQALCDLFGAPPRRRGSPLTDFHRDVARSLQHALEEILLAKVRHLATRVSSPRLVMAGGVALNCVANGRILREGPFEELFVQPAAGDAGGCLGAAVLAHRQLTGEPPRVGPLRHAFWGPSFGSEEIARMLAAAGLLGADSAVDDFRIREEDLLAAVADRLAAGQVVGWFCGRMEFGPRALGARSILASPLGEGMRDRVNRSVKKREAFRPFAPAVLAEEAGRYFDLAASPRGGMRGPSAFMLEVARVISERPLPAVTHVDGTARPQTVDGESHPRFAALLRAFRERTGCPVLLNTSFNLAGEPIVATPVDALITFARSDLDALVLEDFLLDRRALPAHWPELFATWDRLPPSPFGHRKGKSAISENLYTFV